MREKFSTDQPAAAAIGADRYFNADHDRIDAGIFELNARANHVSAPGLVGG